MRGRGFRNCMSGAGRGMGLGRAMQEGLRFVEDDNQRGFFKNRGLRCINLERFTVEELKEKQSLLKGELERVEKILGEKNV